MSEDVNQFETELFGASDDTEGSPEEASTTQESEENQDNDDSNDELEVIDKAAEQREKQIASWQSKIDRGEAELKDIPHEWIKKAIKKPSKAQDVDIDSIVEKKLAEREEKKAYEIFVRELRQSGLDSETKTEIAENFKDLVEDGVSKFKAIRSACKMANIKDLESYERSKKYASMALPRAGRSTRKSVNLEEMGLEEYKRVDESKRLAELERLRKSPIS